MIEPVPTPPPASLTTLIVTIAGRPLAPPSRRRRNRVTVEARPAEVPDVPDDGRGAVHAGQLSEIAAEKTADETDDERAAQDGSGREKKVWWRSFPVRIAPLTALQALTLLPTRLPATCRRWHRFARILRGFPRVAGPFVSPSVKAVYSGVYGDSQLRHPYALRGVDLTPRPPVCLNRRPGRTLLA